jgi:hypothetical protein
MLFNANAFLFLFRRNNFMGNNVIGLARGVPKERLMQIAILVYPRKLPMGASPTGNSYQKNIQFGLLNAFSNSSCTDKLCSVINYAA